MAEWARAVKSTAGASLEGEQVTGITGSLKGLRVARGPAGMDFIPYIRGPTPGPSGSGFTANERPVLYYKPILDVVDNPQFGLSLCTNYSTQTKVDYQPPLLLCSDGTGPFPNVLNKADEGSGFHQLKSYQKTQSLQPETDYQHFFGPHCFLPAVNYTHVNVGPKTETGFTEERDRQCLTFQDKNRIPVEPHQIHRTTTKTDFMQSLFPQGAEPLPALSGRSCRDSGFTRGDGAPLAFPSSLLTSPQTAVHSGVTGHVMGKKEPSGSLSNTSSDPALPGGPFDQWHFITHYKNAFCNINPEVLVGAAPEGVTADKESGFSRRDLDRLIFRR